VPAPLYLVNAYVQHDGYTTGEVVNVRIDGVQYTGEVLEVTPLTTPRPDHHRSIGAGMTGPGTTRAG
jgi:phage tail tube protein FII